MRFLTARFSEKCIRPLYALLMSTADDQKTECLKKQAREVLVHFNSEITLYTQNMLDSVEPTGGSLHAYNIHAIYPPHLIHIFFSTHVQLHN